VLSETRAKINPSAWVSTNMYCSTIDPLMDY
jgi:hypothetical protein